MSPHEIREWRASDAEAWLSCQRACFGAERAKTLADFTHAFDAGGQPTRGLLALQERRVVAACVGTPSRTWFDGEVRTCVHWVDLMVRPEHRAGLGGQRLHREVAEAFFATYGDGAGDLLHHGWPIAPARRFGERFLGYQLVREELCLVREFSEGDLPGTVSECEVLHDLPATSQELRWLWDRCAGEWGLSTIRDGAWARWRFLQHPSVNYRLLGVREDGVLRGFAVVRETPWHWPGALALCDWLVPAGESVVASQLEQGALRVARELGLTRVVTLLPPHSSASLWFQGAGWRVHPTPYQWLIRSFDPRVDAAWVHRHGWFTLGDSDLA